MWRIAMIIGCLILEAAPAAAQDKATIEKLNDAWMAAFNKGDAASVARCTPRMPLCSHRAPRS